MPMSIKTIEGSPPTAATAPAGIAVPGNGVAGSRAQAEAPPVPLPAPAIPAAADVAKAVLRANHAMSAMAASVQFFVDPETKTMVVKVVDTTNNEVLRQVPAQEMLDIARAIDRVRGLLLHTEV
jgi:flagellar protein FlaG